MLIFPDGCQVGVNDLDSIFDEAYQEGKRPDHSIANGLVNRLSKNNYIPSAEWAEYEDVVLREYRKFFEAKEKNKVGNPHPQEVIWNEYKTTSSESFLLPLGGQ